jgi:hypothetical protein
VDVVTKAVFFIRSGQKPLVCDMLDAVANKMVDAFKKRLEGGDEIRRFDRISECLDI